MIEDIDFENLTLKDFRFGNSIIFFKSDKAKEIDFRKIACASCDNSKWSSYETGKENQCEIKCYCMLEHKDLYDTINNQEQSSIVIECNQSNVAKIEHLLSMVKSGEIELDYANNKVIVKQK